MLTLGIDPDLHRLALAWVQDGRLIDAHVLRVPAKVKGENAVVATSQQLSLLSLTGGNAGRLLYPKRIAVESQRLTARPGRRHARPDDVVRLAQVAGVALQWAQVRWPGVEVHLVQPASWKGQVEKGASQARILRSLGLGFEIRGSRTARYAVPENPPRELSRRLTATDWKHAVDAAGLAAWIAQDEPRRPV